MKYHQVQQLVAETLLKMTVREKVKGKTMITRIVNVRVMVNRKIKRK